MRRSEVYEKRERLSLLAERALRPHEMAVNGCCRKETSRTTHSQPEWREGKQWQPQPRLCSFFLTVATVTKPVIRAGPVCMHVWSEAVYRPTSYGPVLPRPRSVRLSYTAMLGPRSRLRRLLVASSPRITRNRFPPANLASSRLSHPRVMSSAN